MNERHVSILGTRYRITEQTEEENRLLKDCDGYCDWDDKEIVLEREITGNLGNMEAYIRKVLRHEIVHAMLMESGLGECSGGADAWARSEEAVDWIARQGEKLYQAWREAGALG